MFGEGDWDHPRTTCCRSLQNYSENDADRGHPKASLSTPSVNDGANHWTAEDAPGADNRGVEAGKITVKVEVYRSVSAKHV